MRTAVDSSVLILLLRKQTGWESWRDCLAAAATEGPLLICPVVFAECGSGYPSAEIALRQFKSIQLQYDPISPEAAWLAGETFIRYRQMGGPREALIPDFLVGAHAQLQADRLAATDRGYLRQYFKSLALLQPTSDAS